MLGTADAAKFVTLINRVVQLPNGEWATGADIFLFNFAIGGAALRPQHVKWMDDWFGALEMELVFQGLRFSWRALIVGEASRSGSQTNFDNVDLSRRRALSVQSYLQSPLIINRPPDPRIEPGGAHGTHKTKIRDVEITIDSEGSRLALSNKMEDSHDRQVVLRLQERSGPPLPPIGLTGAKPQNIRLIDQQVKTMHARLATNKRGFPV